MWNSPLLIVILVNCCPNIGEAACGWDAGGRPAIFRGFLVEDQRRWPGMVSIQWANGSGHFCSGTLINSGWVLSAAHCVEGLENKTESVMLVFGSLNLNRAENTRITRNVSEIHLHQDYVFNSSYPNPLFIMNDIALIRISGEVPLTSHIQPVKLPDANPVFYRECHAIGWGQWRYKGPTGGPLQETYVRSFPSSLCALAHPHMVSMIRNGHFVCALGFLGGRICQGDSGGPMLCKIGLDTEWSLVGVASWTTGVCGYNERPFGFAEVKHFLAWINQTQEKSDGPPTPRLDLTVRTPAGSDYGELVALPGGEALVPDFGFLRRKVVRLDRRGRVVPPVFTCRTSYGNIGLVLDGDQLYVIEDGGLIRQVRVSSLNITQGVWRVPGVRLVFTGAVVSNVLYLIDSNNGSAFSFNLVNQSKEVKTTGLIHPVSITTTTLHSPTRRIFIISEKVATGRIKIYSQGWSLTATIGQGQLRYPEQVLVTPWSTLLVADNGNHMVLEFSLSGGFIRHLLTSRDGLHSPRHISYSRPYLWVVHYTKWGGPYTVRRYQIVQ